MLNSAKEFFYNNEYLKAKELFHQMDYLYEEGLCELVLGNKEKAKELWLNIKNPTSASEWGLIILDIIDLKISKYPSFFQIRAFLEVYLDLLIKNKHFVWAQNVLSAIEFFAKVNPECYKFAARVLFSNKYFKLTHEFLNKSFEIFDGDPEAHFIASQTYYFEQDYKNSHKSILSTLKAVPSYVPALEFKKVIEQKLN